MAPTAPTPSARLVRAAAAERNELARHRERLLVERARLRDQLDHIDVSLHEIDERQALLERLAGTPASHETTPEPTVAAAPTSSTAGATMLRGPGIRRTAVEVLLADPQHPEALHYREWFDRLRAAGFEVAGKNPLAVFLTQLSRSPVVTKSTTAGVYSIDSMAPQRLQRKLDRLHEELRTLTTSPSATTDLAAIRARRAELTAAISQTEKALEEAAAVLHADQETELAAAIG